MRRAAVPWRMAACAWLLLCAPASGVAQSAATGTVRGVVQAAPTNVALPYAVVSIPALNLERFSGAEGQFLLPAVPAGTHELVVRRIGFVPQRQQVVVVANGTTTLSISLRQVPVRLTGMTVRATKACTSPGLPDSLQFPEVAQLVGLLRENAATYRTLVQRFPFVYAQVRALGELDEGTMAVRSVDTLAVPAQPKVRYEPGRVVQTTRGKVVRETFMAIPSIIDLVDPAFVNNHCFTYAGASVQGSETWFQLDVRASERLRTPDVHGAFFLDSATAQLRRMELELSRPERLPASLRGVRSVIAHSTFVEIAPGLSILQSVCAINWQKPRQGTRVSHGAELQHTLAWEFTIAPPDVERVTIRTAPPWRPATRLPGSALPCAGAEP
jgi:Carboxypeptidase regulatory-like domain